MAEFEELQELFSRACETPSYEDYVRLQEGMLEYLEQMPGDTAFLGPWKESLAKHIEELRRYRIMECPDCKGETTMGSNFCLTCHSKGKVMVTIEKLK